MIKVFLVKVKQSLELHAKKGLDDNPLVTQCGLKLESCAIHHVVLRSVTKVTCKECREKIKSNLGKLFELLGETHD